MSPDAPEVEEGGDSVPPEVEEGALAPVMRPQPEELAVRPARPADVSPIADLEARAFPLDPWSPTLVAEGVGGRVPTVRFVVAESGGRFAGHAAVSVVDDVAELQRIAVPDEMRRRGVGTALLAWAVDVAVDGGAERLLLEVREDNESARAFYAAHGFAELARRRRYYRDGTDAVVLEARLG